MASRVRVLLVVVLVIFLGAIGLGIAQRVRHPIRVVRGARMLVYDVPAAVDDVPPVTPPFSFDNFRRQHPSLNDITAALRQAADDHDVRAVVLHVGEVEWGWAKVAEMREALAAFRAAGKPVYVSLQGGANQAYLLASGADRIAMPQTAMVQLNGLTASAMFLKGTYDKLGITPNFAHVGQYKSAVEQYTRTSMSPPSRASLETLLDTMYGLLVDSLATARGVTPERMRSIIDDGPFTASSALAAGLVDTLLDEPDLDSLAAHAGGGRPLVPVDLERYVGDASSTALGDQVALVGASGTIMPGRSHDSPWSGEQLGSETLIASLRDLRSKRSVRAVILRIDSPGGSGQASDDVWQEVRRLRRVKPVVVSMSNLAASGGYYIACGADAIVAEPGTLTGSIGVFGGKLNVLGLYHKLGLEVETVSRGRHAEMLSPMKDFTPEEAQRFQASLEDFYRVFLARVSSGRGMTTAAVDSVAQGRVWTGTQALRFGLVDTLGGVPLAFEIAKRKAHLGKDAPVTLVVWPPPRHSMFRQIIADMVEEQDQTRIALPPVVSAWARAASFPAGAALAMMPVEITIR